MMAFDFLSTSSSVKAGFGRQGEVGDLPCLTARRKRQRREQTKLDHFPLESQLTSHT